MNLVSLDDLGQDFIINIMVQRNGQMTHMAIEGALPSRSLWNVTILPYGCEADTVVNNIELSRYNEDRMLSVVTG